MPRDSSVNAVRSVIPSSDVFDVSQHFFTYSFLFARISYSSTVFTIRYDTIEEFNVDSKAEYSLQLI